MGGAERLLPEFALAVEVGTTLLWSFIKAFATRFQNDHKKRSHA